MNAQQALSAKVMESTLSMQIHAWIAVLVQAFAQHVLSSEITYAIIVSSFRLDKLNFMFCIPYSILDFF